ncbi:aldo/keto reductase [Halomonas eurihalina]|uniref:Aldo/keto reductase n=1 Tax=Halomonas eurihalina TaxID=42566 RepID=A0A5D9CIV5_HALER|nr:aldo/keto reductase [Halomonas eurihalina]MDR5861255.1 aldo/keto reductase [Halomonas eurihalina]TZG31162.1 aldo/keto reductase [Halomonas eurihalina]
MTHDHTVSTTLHHRTLGQGLSVSALGYGAMGISEFYGPSNDQDSLRLLAEVANAGIDLIDTADMYGRGHNETLIGEFLAERRRSLGASDIKIATKCGIDRGDADYARQINNRPEYIRACCEASLKRLGIERLDLYYLHRVDPQGNITAAMECLSELVKEGKIAHVGLCEVSASTLDKAHAIHPITALQTEYSLWTRDVEAEILPMARRLGVGLVPYSPLGRGFLTGRITSQDDLSKDDFRRRNPRFQADNLSHNLTLLETVHHVAERHDATPGQVALAWLLAQDEHIVPIPGTRRSAYLHENLGALALRLDEQDLDDLDSALPPDAARGERYTEEGMKGVNT